MFWTYPNFSKSQPVTIQQSVAYTPRSEPNCAALGSASRPLAACPSFVALIG